MKSADFILIQVNQHDKYFEVARLRPYFKNGNVDEGFDEERGFYCHGIAQNNHELLEFSLHLGQTENDIRQKHVLLYYPVCSIGDFDRDILLIPTDEDFSYYNDCEGIGI